MASTSVTTTNALPLFGGYSSASRRSGMPPIVTG
jgi:hypothetical protein